MLLMSVLHLLLLFADAQLTSWEIIVRFDFAFGFISTLTSEYIVSAAVLFLAICLLLKACCLQVPTNNSV